MTIDELMQLEIGLRILYIVFAYLITAIAFSIIPLLVALLRKKIITRKGYSIVCYSVNLPILIVDSILSGGNLKLAAYLIWTSFAIWLGRKFLNNKSLLDNSGYKYGAYSPEYEDILNESTENPKKEYINKSAIKPTNPPKIKFCSRCGGKINPDSKKCSKCGKQYFRGLKHKANNFSIK